jgi:hypothetical protein
MAVTTDYSFNLPTVGGNLNTWGALLNANFTALDSLLSGDTTLTGLDVTGSVIEATTVGAVTPSTGSFTTLSATSFASASVNIDGGTIDGATITGATITGGTITGGTIEATAIGGTTAAAGSFTTASASSAPTDDAHLTRKDYVDANVSTYFIVQETQADGTNGGTFASGAWRTRLLNTTQHNGISGASLGSNRVTLPAGTYRINGHAAAAGVSYHQARLYNITASATLIIGNKATSSSSQSGSEVVGVLTLGATTVIELQHYAADSQSEYGFGKAGGTTFGERNLYAYLEIEKIS